MLFSKNKGGKIKFIQAHLKESVDYTMNPCRGFYMIHTFTLDKKPDINDLEWSVDRKARFAMAIVNISAAGADPLTETHIGYIRRILNFFRENEYSIIFRAVYDHEGKAMEKEPENFKTVLTHIGQIGDIVKEYDDIIFVYQGLLIGNWGEMHTSKFLKTEQLEKMADILRERVGDNVYLAVRKPVYFRILHKKQLETATNPEDHMGLFDDGLFGSYTNLGTFGEKDKERRVTGWSNAWRREDELSFEKELCNNVPNGGEIVYGDEEDGGLFRDGNYMNSALVPKFLEDCKTMHLTYLNKNHDVRAWELFKGVKMQGSGVWKDMSLYDYMGAHLGYRMLVKKVSLKTDNETPDKVDIDVEIENTGFARMYYDATVYIDYTDKNGNQGRVSLGAGLRSIAPGMSMNKQGSFDAGSGELYISMQRMFDSRRIFFGNESDKEGRVHIGTIEKK